VRGGHQVEWLLDGVPVPNTSLSSNVGPQFDPKDIDSLEAQRGGFSAEYGDRAYGVFNVSTRSGFERDDEGELVASFGTFLQTDDQLSFGSHTDRFAYYFSVNGNRTDLGLEPPVPDAIHDQAAGLGTFGSLIFNVDPQDQLRLVTAVRGDHFQVPNTPEQQAAGVADVEDERDAFVNFSWVRTAGNGVVVTVSPFYHFNRAHYIGGPSDLPVSPQDDRGLNYGGGVVNVSWATSKNNLRAGLQGYAEHDNELFAVTAPAPAPSLSQRQIAWGATSSAYVEDQFRATDWLSLNAGLRLTHFSGPLNEDAATPRAGVSVRIPRLHWFLRAFYGRYYQPPPLLTVGGPLLEFAAQQGFAFLPLHGERDEQHEFGLTIPLRGWTFDVDTFRTGARNFFDHDALGNSNIFFPVAIQSARIHGWETTVTSPTIAGRAQFHLVYSHQYVEGKGGVTGGLTDFEPPSDGYFFLDHDQRDTLNAGVRLTLPWRMWTSQQAMYGSGFLDGDGPAHLPGYATWDLSLGRSFGERLSAQVDLLNVTDERYLLDNSNTFGGTHFNRPREVIVQLRYRFRYR
jgi:outer membrane receptor protein involved in Fe transport